MSDTEHDPGCPGCEERERMRFGESKCDHCGYHSLSDATILQNADGIFRCRSITRCNERAERLQAVTV